LTSASPWFDRAGLMPASSQSLIRMSACFGRAVPFGQRSTKRAHGVGAYIPDRPLIILVLTSVPHACPPGVNDEHPELI
jgi:hypothetical protein